MSGNTAVSDYNPSFTPNGYMAPNNVSAYPVVPQKTENLIYKFPETPDYSQSSSSLKDRHEAFSRAQDILNSRHYETQEARLDSEIRLADWLLGLTPKTPQA